jgi:hypothetical protein
MRRFAFLFAMVLFMVSASLVSAQTGINSEQLDPGGHRLQWSGNWYLDLDASIAETDFEALVLQNGEMLFGVVVYGNTASGAELRNVFVDGFGSELATYGTIDSGSRSGVHWELGSGSGVTLYAVFIDGGLNAQSLGYFVIAPTGSFASTVTTVQRDFTLDGGPVLRGVDGAGLQQRAQSAGGNQVANVPVTQNSVFVYGTEVGWTGAWQQDVAASTVDQVAFTQIDQAAGVMKLVSYGEFTDSSVFGTSQALSAFAEGFFSSIGTFDSRQLDGGTLTNGAEWRLYRFTYNGIDLSTFMTVSQMANGSFAVTTVTGNANMMTLTITEVQQQFSLDRSRSLLQGVDPNLVTLSLLM